MYMCVYIYIYIFIVFISSSYQYIRLLPAELRLELPDAHRGLLLSYYDYSYMHYLHNTNTYTTKSHVT